MFKFPIRAVLLSASFIGIAATTAHANIFADSSIEYVQGTIDAGYSTYNNPSTAIGKPVDDVNVGQPFGYAPLTPFNGTWQDTQMVGIGAGGHLTLHLGQTAAKVGVHAGVGLIDNAYPNGTNLPSAFPYTAPRIASVSVSNDGTTYVPLGSQTFDLPTNFYDQGITVPGNATSPGTHEANFAKPFNGQLSDFSGQDWTGTLGVLDGSAGGTWFDLTGILPTGANFIRFDVGANQVMFVDAVATQVVPEPTTGMLLFIPAILALRRKRRAIVG